MILLLGRANQTGQLWSSYMDVPGYGTRVEMRAGISTVQLLQRHKDIEGVRARSIRHKAVPSRRQEPHPHSEPQAPPLVKHLPVFTPGHRSHKTDDSRQISSVSGLRASTSAQLAL